MCTYFIQPSCFHIFIHLAYLPDVYITKSIFTPSPNWAYRSQYNAYYYKYWYIIWYITCILPLPWSSCYLQLAWLKLTLISLASVCRGDLSRLLWIWLRLKFTYWGLIWFQCARLGGPGFQYTRLRQLDFSAAMITNFLCFPSHK